MKKVLLLGFLIFLIGASIFFMLNNNNVSKTTIFPSPSPSASALVNYKASFLIYTNGVRRDFGFDRYYNLSSDVYIDPIKPTTVNVKKSEITWDDFFKTLPMKVTNECLTTGTEQVFCNNNETKLTFYINGVPTKDFLKQGIKNNDKVLIHYGVLNNDTIKSELNEIPQP